MKRDKLKEVTHSRYRSRFLGITSNSDATQTQQVILTMQM
jgi:hypothetical protein